MTSDSSDIAAVWRAADGRSMPARLRITAAGNLHVKDDAGGERTIAAGDAAVTPRLANIPRQLTLADGAVLLVADNDFVDKFLRAGGRGGGGVLTALESRLYWLPLLALAAAFVYWLLTAHIVPAAGDYIARRATLEFRQSVTAEIMETLRREEWLGETKLPPEQKQRVQDSFARLAFARGDAANNDYRVETYRMRGGIANAFAFPDGLIVATDRLVLLLPDDELLAVLAHEIAHVQEQHGMRVFARAIGVTGIGVFIFGDLTGALAANIVGLQYSREFETEADCIAFRTLRAAGVDPKTVGTALQRLEGEMFGGGRKERKTDDESIAGAPPRGEDGEDGGGKIGEALLTLLSSHPPTEARADPQTHCAAVWPAAAGGGAL